MTTATTPLESFQSGRNTILTAMLDAMNGLEGSVLEFQHQHEGRGRAADLALSSALSENARLKNLVGEQAEELSTARSHACTVPEAREDTAATPTQVELPPVPEEAGRDGSLQALEELRAELEWERQVSAGLRTELEKEQRAATTLRDELAAVGTQETALEARIREGARSAEAAVRGEAVRIIDAIAADNPALAEAADLFTVAFQSDPAPSKPIVDDWDAEPETRPADPNPATKTETSEADAVGDGLEDAVEDFLDTIPDPGTDSLPAPLTQAYQPSPASDEALTPDFFDTPADLKAPDGEPDPAPKPGNGLFGRKKEKSNV